MANGHRSDELYTAPRDELVDAQENVELRGLAAIVATGLVLLVPAERELAGTEFWYGQQLHAVRAARDPDDGSWLVEFVADEAGGNRLVEAGLGDVVVVEHLGGRPLEGRRPLFVEFEDGSPEEHADPRLARQRFFVLGVRMPGEEAAINLVHDVLDLGRREQAEGILAPHRVAGPTALVIKPIALPPIPLSPTDPERPPWDIDPPRRLEVVARPVTVAVVDTGLPTHVQTDPLLHNARPGRVGMDEEADPADGAYLPWAAGHGTFVAGLIARFAPEVELVTYRVFEPQGVGSDASVAAALHHAIHVARADYVNLSLGFYDLPGHWGCPPLTAAVLADAPASCTVVAAAGNDSLEGVPCWPAAHERVLGVSANDVRYGNKGAWVSFSTHARWVAPFRTGDEDPLLDDDHDPEDWPCVPAAASWEGTSFAAAAITGSLANLALNGATALQAIAMLATSGQYWPGLGVVVPTGTRRPA